MIKQLSKQLPVNHPEVTINNVEDIVNRDGGRQRLATLLTGSFMKYQSDTTVKYKVPDPNIDHPDPDNPVMIEKEQYMLCKDDRDFYNELLAKADKLSEVDAHAVINFVKEVAGQASIAEAEQWDNGRTATIQQIASQARADVQRTMEEDPESLERYNNLPQEYQEAEYEKLFQERFGELFQEYAHGLIRDKASEQANQIIANDPSLRNATANARETLRQQLYAERYVELQKNYEENGFLPGGYDESPDDPRENYNVKDGRPSVDHKIGFYYNGRNLIDKFADSMMDMMEASQEMEDNHFGAALKRGWRKFDGMLQSISGGYKNARLNDGFTVPGWLKPLKYLVVNPLTARAVNKAHNFIQRVDKALDNFGIGPFKVAIGPLSLFKRGYNLFSMLWPETGNSVTMEKVDENRKDLNSFNRYLINESADLNTKILNMPTPAREIAMGILEFHGMTNYSQQHMTFSNLDPSMKKFVLQHLESAVDINDGATDKDDVELKKETYLRMKRADMRKSALSKARNAPTQGKAVFMAYNLVDSLHWNATKKLTYHSTHLLASAMPENDEQTKAYLTRQAEFPGDLGTMKGWVSAYSAYDYYLAVELNQRLNPVQDYARTADDYTRAGSRALDRRANVLRRNISRMFLTSENLEHPQGDNHFLKTMNPLVANGRDGLVSMFPGLGLGKEAAEAHLNDQVLLNGIYRTLLRIDGEGNKYIENTEAAHELIDLYKVLTTTIRGMHGNFAHQNKLNISAETERKLREVPSFGDFLPKKSKLSLGDVISSVADYATFQHREYTRSIDVFLRSPNMSPTEEHVLTRAGWQDPDGAYIREPEQQFAKRVTNNGKVEIEYQEFEGYMIVIDDDGHFVHTDKKEGSGENAPYARAVSYAMLDGDEVKGYRERVIKGIKTFYNPGHELPERQNLELKKYFWDRYKEEHDATGSFEEFAEHHFQEKLDQFIADECAVNPLTSKRLNPREPGRVSDEVHKRTVFGHGDLGAAEPMGKECYFHAFDFTGKILGNKVKGSTLGGNAEPIYDFMRDKNGRIPTMYGNIDSKKMRAMFLAFRANNFRLHNVALQRRKAALGELSSTVNNCKLMINKAAGGLKKNQVFDIEKRGRAKFFSIASPQGGHSTSASAPETDEIIPGRQWNDMRAGGFFDKYSGFDSRHYDNIPRYFRDRESADSVYNEVVPFSRQKKGNYTERMLVETFGDLAGLAHLPRNDDGTFVDYWELGKLPNPATDHPGLNGFYDVYAPKEQEKYDRNQLERAYHNSSYYKKQLELAGSSR